MSKNTVERTEGCHVVSMKCDPTVDIPKGSAVVMSGDYEVTALGTTGTFAQGVALELHSSGVYDCIPVLLPGPVLRVIAGSGDLNYGENCNGDPSVPGEWILDSANPAGFALESATDGNECDICFVGEQY